MADMNLNKIRVNIISGFLGAGKTTLIQTLIEHGIYSDSKLMVLENEFGRVDIDSGLLERLDVELDSIVSSCICCSGAVTLQDKLSDIAVRVAPRYLLLEPTGVARLSDVKRIFCSARVKEHYRLYQIITVVDAVNYADWLKVSKGLFEDQVRFSDILFISKSACCEQRELERLCSLLEKIHPHCPVFINESSLFDYLKKDVMNEASNGMPFITVFNQIPNDFETCSFEGKGVLDLFKFEQLLGRLNTGIYGDIYRLKGIFPCGGGKWHSIEYVSHDYQITDLEFVDDIPMKLCIIGKDLTMNALEESLRNCIV